MFDIVPFFSSHEPWGFVGFLAQIFLNCFSLPRQAWVLYQQKDSDQHAVSLHLVAMVAILGYSINTGWENPNANIFWPTIPGFIFSAIIFIQIIYYRYFYNKD